MQVPYFTDLRQVGLLATVVSLLVTPALAEEHPDVSGVMSAAHRFYSALTHRDMAAMEEVWASDPTVVLINPRDKGVTLGWEAAKTNWNRAFSFWSEFKVTPRDIIVRVNGDDASVNSQALVEGQTRDGKPAAFTVLNTQVFEKRGERWLLVSHHSSMSPE